MEITYTMVDFGELCEYFCPDYRRFTQYSGRDCLKIYKDNNVWEVYKVKIKE